MIAAIGIDIVRISRLKPKLRDKVLCSEEKAMYDSFQSEVRKQEFLAGRFAVKEALVKAFTGIDKVCPFPDMCILNDESGKPYLAKPVLKGYRVMISLSHEKEYAAAFCILETDQS